MSMSLSQVISEAGYDLSTKEDAQWLISQVNNFEDLVTKAEDLLDEDE